MTRKWKKRSLWAIPTVAALVLSYDALISFAVFKMATGLSLGIIATRIYEKYQWGKTFYLQGWHFHHSLFGILIVMSVLSLALLYPGVKASAPHLLGLAVGNILQHTVAERKLVFLNRDRKELAE